MRQILPGGFTLSRPECTPAEYAAWRLGIADALMAAWRKDVDISDLVSRALTDVATVLYAEGHAVDAITVHRSGSWEAEHVRALASVALIEMLASDDPDRSPARTSQIVRDVVGPEGTGGDFTDPNRRRRRGPR